MPSRVTKVRRMADVMPNRKKITVTWAAASTTYVYTEWDTGISIRNGQGLLLHGMDVHFNGMANNHALSLTTCVRFQAYRGGNTGALLDVDDSRELYTIDRAIDRVTAEGIWGHDWPMGVRADLLVVEPKITLAMDATVDAAPFQTVEMLFTIWYRWVPMDMQDYIEAAEGTGTF